MYKIVAKSLLILSLLVSVAAQAQELVVKSFEQTDDVLWGSMLRKDVNEQQCALVKVMLPEADVLFENNVVGDVEYKAGIYWVYLTTSYTKSFRVTYPGCKPMLITFSDYGIQQLRPKGVYLLEFDWDKLRVNNLNSAVEQRNKGYLVLNVTPANATVLIDGSARVLDDGSLMEYLSLGSHSYEVSAPGYETEIDVVTIGLETITRNVTLRSVMAHLQLSCETSGVQFYVNGRLRGTGSWTGDLLAGSYHLEARKDGYHSAEQNITLAESDSRNVTFPALSMITGMLNVGYRPVGTEVWIDGKKVGKSPDVFDLMVGQHSVELRSSGYETRKSSVTISEGQESRLEGSLNKQTTTVAASSTSGGSSSSGVSGASGTHNGYGYVDLGLPSGLKWATCNVGAGSPEDYGDYYAWGETSIKKKYTEKNSTTYEKNIGDIKGTSRDVAHVKWGGSWRMPTRAEFDELINEDNCTWEWTTLNGTKGCKVTSKKNGNSIFLPAAGYRAGTSLYYTGTLGDYWRSTPYESDSRGAYCLYFRSSDYHTYWRDRYYGHTIRPVAEEGSLSKQTTTVAASSISGGSSSSGVSGASGTHNGYEYVDLGLPSGLKWAACNVGADSPEDYGDYYAWGETSTKSSYDEDNCATWDKSIGDIKGTSRDVAHVKWGGSWRMPTEAEFDELLNEDNCTWEWTTLNGNKGYKVTSRKNGNSIFLPAAGYCVETSLRRTDMSGYYWSSTPDESGAQSAKGLGLSSDYRSWLWYHRNNGFSVRPVAEFSSGYEARKSSVTISEGQESRLEGSLNKQAAASTTSSGGSVGNHQYVDLGLSVKWATCNVGASSPEEYGDYYAWGETKTKSSYDEDNCETWEKDIGDIKGTSRDVAHVKWGGSWRMPTRAEFEELLNKDNCTWEWTTLNGKKGYKVTSRKNGNSIFLPAAGWRNGPSLYYAGQYSDYWSSTPHGSITQYAYRLYFYGSDLSTDWSYRSYGRSVRPVAE